MSDDTIPLRRHLRHMPKGTVLSASVYDDAKAQGIDVKRFIRSEHPRYPGIDIRATHLKPGTVLSIDMPDVD